MEEGVEFREGGGRLGVNECGAPAIGVDECDEVEFDLGFYAGPEHPAVGRSSLPADVVEGGARAFGFEHLGCSESVGVGDFAVVLSGDLRGGDAEAEETGINGAEGFLDGGVIQKILVDEGAEFGTGVHERAAGDGADLVDDGGGEASVEDAAACGTCGSKEEDFHGF